MQDEEAQRKLRGRSFDALHDFAARVTDRAPVGTEPIDAAAAQVLAAFEAAGVDALLLKGRALAELLYASGQRAYSDVDLLVAPHSRRAAEHVLTGMGYTNASAVQGIDDVGGVVHAQLWLRSGPDAVGDPTIDLHHRFPGSRAEPAIAWAALGTHRIWIDVADRQAPVLDRTGQAMQLATHAAQHGPGFVKHTDELALAIARWPREVWAAAAGLAREIGALEPYGAGLRLLTEGRALASELALPSTAERDWEMRNRAGRPRGTFHLGALVDASSTRERLNILRRSLFPARAWMRHQYSWTAGGPVRLLAGYVVHLLRAPVWAARAWQFNRRARRSADRP